MILKRLISNKNAPRIFTCCGAIGVIATGVVAAIQTPKFIDIIKNKTEKKGEELSFGEKAIEFGKVYAPAFAVGASSIFCIFAANDLNAMRFGGLSSAYCLMIKNKNKRIDTVKNDAFADKKEDISEKSNAIFADEKEDEIALFYETMCGNYFSRTKAEVNTAQYKLNNKLIIEGYASLNDFYKYLNLPETLEGAVLGWDTFIGKHVYNYDFIDISHERIIEPYKPPCLTKEWYMIIFNNEPTPDFAKYNP